MKRTLVLLAGWVALAGCGTDHAVAQGESSAPGQDNGVPPRPTVDGTPGSCASATAWLLEGESVLRVDVDGTERRVFTFGAAVGLGSDGVVVNDWFVKDGFAAGAAFLYAPPNPHRYEFVVMDAQGDVRFHDIREAPYNPYVHFGDDGWLAIGAEQSRVVSPQGTVTELGAWRPLAPPLAGHVAVTAGEPWNETVAWGWLRISDLVFTPVGVASQGGTWVVQDGTLVHVDYSESGSTLLVGTPGDMRTLPLPDGGWFAPITRGAGRWLLLGSHQDRRVVRVDLRTPQVQAVLGSEGTPGSWDTWSAAVTGTGEVWSMRRTEDGLMHITHTADLGETWETVGTPMQVRQDFGLGSRLQLFPAGRSVLALNLSMGYGDFLDEVQLVTPQGSRVLTTGGLYVNSGIFPGAADVDATGGCAVTLVQREGTVFTEDARFDLVFLAGSGVATTARTSTKPALVRFARR